MRPRAHLAIRTTALVAVILTPVLLLMPHDRGSAAAPAPIAVAALPATRDLEALPAIFGVGERAPPDIPEGADGRPRLVGVAGRLPDDAVALIRLPGETTQTIKVGDTVMEWRLIALQSDRAVFVRGDERYDSILDPTE